MPAQLLPLCGGRRTVTVPGRTVREVLDGLAKACPGLAGRLLEDGALAPDLAMSVDGVLATLGMLQPVGESSEVFIVPAIAGG